METSGIKADKFHNLLLVAFHDQMDTEHLIAFSEKRFPARVVRDLHQT